MRVTIRCTAFACVHSAAWIPSRSPPLTTHDNLKIQMKKILLTLLAVPFLTVAVQAEDAKPPKPDKPKMDPAAAFKKMDADSNGKVTLEEFKASPRWKKDPSKADEMFKKRDKDSSGDISMEEFTAKPEKPAKPGKGKDGKPGEGGADKKP